MTDCSSRKVLHPLRRKKPLVPRDAASQNTPAQQGAPELVREALAHYALGRYDAMLAACEHALSVEKTYARAHHAKALALMGRGQFGEAVISALRLTGGTPLYYLSSLVVCGESEIPLCAWTEDRGALGLSRSEQALPS